MKIRAFLILLLLVNFFVGGVFSRINVFFSPEDKIRDELISRINSVKRIAYVAVYMLTDKKLVDALIRLKNSGNIDIQVVTDLYCLEYKYGKIKKLVDSGVDVFVFKPRGVKNNNRKKIMHNKFALLDDCVCTGSFNWTAQANYRNFENLVCFDDIDVYKKYVKHFHMLKRVCVNSGIVMRGRFRDVRVRGKRLFRKRMKKFLNLIGSVGYEV